MPRSVMQVLLYYCYRYLSCLQSGQVHQNCQQINQYAQQMATGALMAVTLLSCLLLRLAIKLAVQLVLPIITARSNLVYNRRRSNHMIVHVSTIKCGRLLTNLCIWGYVSTDATNCENHDLRLFPVGHSWEVLIA